MEVKTVIAIVLVMFIVGGAIWLNIRDPKEEVKCLGAAFSGCPLSIYGGMYAEIENH